MRLPKYYLIDIFIFVKSKKISFLFFHIKIDL